MKSRKTPGTTRKKFAAKRRVTAKRNAHVANDGEYQNEELQAAISRLRELQRQCTECQVVTCSLSDLIDKPWTNRNFTDVCFNLRPTTLAAIIVDLCDQLDFQFSRKQEAMLEVALGALDANCGLDDTRLFEEAEAYTTGKNGFRLVLLPTTDGGSGVKTGPLSADETIAANTAIRQQRR